MVVKLYKFHAICYRILQITLYSNRVSLMRKDNTKYKYPSIRNFENIKFFIGLAFLWPVKKNEALQSESNSEQETTAVSKADTFFENGHYDECCKLLESVTDGKEDVEVQWRLCRVMYNMSKESNLDKKSKRDVINKAYKIISEQLEKNADHYAVQKWYALLLDAKSSGEGISERISQLENVKKHMDLAVTLNPNDATTLHMLGEWCYQVTSMPWHQKKIAETLFAKLPQSTYEDALEYFLRAETVQPRFYSLNLLRIGMCYLKLKKEDQAKYYLRLAAVYPAKSNDDHQANKEAAEILKRM